MNLIYTIDTTDMELHPHHHHYYTHHHPHHHHYYYTHHHPHHHQYYTHHHHPGTGTHTRGRVRYLDITSNSSVRRMTDSTDWFVSPSPFCLPMLINRRYPQIIIGVTIDSDDDSITR